MVFCSVELAARLERAECRLLTDGHAAVRRRLPDAFVAEVGGGIAVATESGSPLNKVAGLGFAPFDADAWQRVESAFAARGVPVQVEISTLGDVEVARRLIERGYSIVGLENVLGRALEPSAPGTDAHVVVSTAESDETDVWIDTMVTGFGTPDTQGVPSHEQFDRAPLERIMRDIAATPGFVRYLARRDGAVAGAAAMRTGDGTAQLCGAATLPAHRRRGVQAALFVHRLADAARAGATIAVMTTQPGSKSQENAHKQGFALLYSRMVLTKG